MNLKLYLYQVRLVSVRESPWIRDQPTLLSEILSQKKPKPKSSLCLRDGLESGRKLIFWGIVLSLGSVVVHVFNSTTGLHRVFQGYTEKNLSQTSNNQNRNQNKRSVLSDRNHQKQNRKTHWLGLDKVSWKYRLQFLTKKVEATLLSAFLLRLTCVLWHGTERETKKRVDWPASMWSLRPTQFI